MIELFMQRRPGSLEAEKTANFKSQKIILHSQRYGKDLTLFFIAIF